MKIRKYWLLIASYYFYMCWNVKYIILILFSTVVTFISGQLIEKIKQQGYKKKEEKRRKKLVVIGSFILNLGVLGYFKYTNFALNIISEFFSYMHVNVEVPQFDIMLPVGVSFFTFQALSYTMDVYRDVIYAEKNFFNYALFVSFFPQLVAGPIERSKNLLKQLDEPKEFNFERAREGFLLMLWGYFLKIVIADRITIFVDVVYGDVETYSGYYIVVATILFAIQIYCDFSGYSVIAKGTAKILGIELMENFNAPYLSTSVAEFWRNWHISLTSWFKDYLYIPLGGSRNGKAKKFFNKFIVFLISGLWHGASISFVIWGGLNGIYQIIGEMLRPVRNKMVDICNLNRQSLGHKLIQLLITFVLIDFSWIFFRANSTVQALIIIRYMLERHNPWILFDGSLYNCGLDVKNFWLMIISIFILLFADYCKYKKIIIREIIIKQDAWFRCCVIALSITLILTFGIWGPAYDAASFIYFQF